MAVAVSGLLSITSGLVLGGSSVTLESAWADITGRASDDSMAMDSGASPQTGAATVDATGVQHILIEVRETSFSPARVRAKAGVPTRLTLRTDGIRGCTSTFVIPQVGVEQALPETGDTVIDLGALSAGRLSYTCSTGMYGGDIETS